MSPTVTAVNDDVFIAAFVGFSFIVSVSVPVDVPAVVTASTFREYVPAVLGLPVIFPVDALSLRFLGRFSIVHAAEAPLLSSSVASGIS